MNKLTTSAAIPTRALKLEALSKISASFELFCLASGMEALGEMMDRDAQAICGPRHARGRDRRAHRWGKTKGKIGFHGGKVEIERPRLRGFDGKEQPVPSWEAAVAEDWLGKWALNQMLINVATRKFARSVRLPEGDVPGPARAGLSKSAASRRFVALSAARMKDWMASDLSGLDLLVIQIDGISARPLFLGPRSPRGDRCLATSPRSRPARRKCWPCPKRLTPAATAASRVPSISRIGTGLLIEPTRPQPMPSTETHTPLPKDRCSIVPAT